MTNRPGYKGLVYRCCTGLHADERPATHLAVLTDQLVLTPLCVSCFMADRRGQVALAITGGWRPQLQPIFQPEET